VGQIAQTFGVDWAHLLAQVVSFSIVCALLYRLAYTPVLAMLATRRELIAQGLANTEKINAALAAIEAQREQTLAAARDEAAAIVEQARTATSATSSSRRPRLSPAGC
jgi:F0F1-type ATP synthase membrane subunit b/b'